MSYELIKQNIGAVIVVFILFGSWSAFNAQWTWKLFEKSENFEKDRVEKLAKLADRESIIKEGEIKLRASLREFEVTKQLIANQKQQSEMLMDAAHQKELRLIEAERDVSEKAQQIREEEEVKKLMSMVSALGVDLRARPPCDKPELLASYNKGKSLMREIGQRVRAAHLYEKYQGFLDSNTRLLQSSDDDCEMRAAIKAQIDSIRR